MLRHRLNTEKRQKGSIKFQQVFFVSLNLLTNREKKIVTLQLKKKKVLHVGQISTTGSQEVKMVIFPNSGHSVQYKLEFLGTLSGIPQDNQVLPPWTKTE